MRPFTVRSTKGKLLFAARSICVLLCAVTPAYAEAFKDLDMSKVLWTAALFLFGIPIGLALLVYAYIRSDPGEDMVLQGGMYSTIAISCLTWWFCMYVVQTSSSSDGSALLLCGVATVATAVLICRTHRVPNK